MKAIRIQETTTKTDFYTSDFIDVINVIEQAPDGEPVTITVSEMTAIEFNEIIKEHGSTIVD